MDWPCNLNDWRLYYRDNALAAIIPSIQQPPAHQPHQTNPPIVGNRLQRHRGTHLYVLAGGLTLAGFVLGFTNWALDIPSEILPDPIAGESRGCGDAPLRVSTFYCHSSWQKEQIWWKIGRFVRLFACSIQSLHLML